MKILYIFLCIFYIVLALHDAKKIKPEYVKAFSGSDKKQFPLGNGPGSAYGHYLPLSSYSSLLYPKPNWIQPEMDVNGGHYQPIGKDCKRVVLLKSVQEKISEAKKLAESACANVQLLGKIENDVKQVIELGCGKPKE